MRVLVFDDEAAIGRILVRTGTKLGWDATAVIDAAAFAGSVDQNPPQLIILDLNLGDSDGLEQLRLLADRQYDGSLVIMSGSDPLVLAAARVQALSLNLRIASILQKPLRLAQLQEMFAAATPHV
jgi:DNA-binding response OmpR family regulator